MAIGVAENEVTRLLGPPSGTSEWTERHGTVDVPVKEYAYTAGLRVRVHKGEGKVFALGAFTRGAFSACRQVVFGGPATAPAPAPTQAPAPAAQPPAASTPAFLAAMAGRHGVPLPGDVRIVPPAPEVSREVAVFSGAWFGSWGGSLPHILVVEQITADPPGATVVYARGTDQLLRALWIRWRGQFRSGELRLDRFSDGGLIVYRARSSDVLNATLDRQGQIITRATMQRIRE